LLTTWTTTPTSMQDQASHGKYGSVVGNDTCTQWQTRLISRNGTQRIFLREGTAYTNYPGSKSGILPTHHSIYVHMSLVLEVANRLGLALERRSRLTVTWGPLESGTEFGQKLIVKCYWKWQEYVLPADSKYSRMARFPLLHDILKQISLTCVHLHHNASRNEVPTVTSRLAWYSSVPLCRKDCKIFCLLIENQMRFLAYTPT
jgi:hypothetical protein